MTTSNPPRKKMGKKVRNAVFGAVGAILLLAAGAFLNPWFLSIRDAVFSHNDDGALVGQIAIGMPEETARDLFGPPSYSRQVLEKGSATWNEIGWSRHGWLVSAIFNQKMEVEEYSVVACDSSFRPTLTTADGVSVTLHQSSLSKVHPDPATILLYRYSPRSSIDALVDEHTRYSVGTSNLCGKTPDGPEPSDDAFDYVGSPSKAPTAIHAYRDAVAPNFFAEQSGFISSERDESGFLRTDLGDDGRYEILNATDTPTRIEVPAAIVRKLSE